jgi:hypothetical protein
LFPKKSAIFPIPGTKGGNSSPNPFNTSQLIFGSKLALSMETRAK